jgi:hypothetical protein
MWCFAFLMALITFVRNPIFIPKWLDGLTFVV